MKRIQNFDREPQDITCDTSQHVEGSYTAKHDGTDRIFVTGSRQVSSRGFQQTVSRRHAKQFNFVRTLHRGVKGTYPECVREHLGCFYENQDQTWSWETQECRWGGWRVLVCVRVVRLLVAGPASTKTCLVQSRLNV